MTRARLAARADQIAAELEVYTSGGSLVACEESLRDADLRLRGIPDVVIHGSRSAVIDFKTGRDATVPLTDRIRFQLLIYAHLYKCTYGQIPEIVEVFSFLYGPLSVSVDSISVEAALTAITEARAQSSELARPSPAVCTFCTRRFVCEPYWNAVPTWDAPSALEGRIAQIEHAKAGAVALLIDTNLGSRWITRIPRDRLPSYAATGSFVRIINIYCDKNNDSQSSRRIWRAGRLIDIKVCSRDGE